MASHFTVIAGKRPVVCLRSAKGEAPRLHWPARRGPESKREHTFQKESGWPPASGQTARAPLCSLAVGASSAAARHPRSFLNLIVFHFLIITFLPHPKPNTETPSIYEAPRSAIKVSAICYSLPCF